MARTRPILPAVRKLARELDIGPDSPELRLAETLANTLDCMTLDEQVRLGANIAGPLARALAALRDAAPTPVPDEGRGLTDRELRDFLRDLEDEHGSR